MIRSLLALAALPALVAASAPTAIAPGRWGVTSRAVDLVVPGAPSFILKMAKGRSRTEQKCVPATAAASGVAALLVPDPKAKCRIDAQSIGDGAYTQTLTCPGRDGRTLLVARQGRYDAQGFAGRATMTGDTPKGPLRIVLDQQARRIGDCKG